MCGEYIATWLGKQKLREQKRESRKGQEVSSNCPLFLFLLLFWFSCGTLCASWASFGSLGLTDFRVFSVESTLALLK